MTIKVFMASYGVGGVNLGIVAVVRDSGGTWNASYNYTGYSPSVGDNAASITAAATTAMLAYLAGQGVPTPDAVEWLTNTSPPSSYSFANPTRSLNSAFQISASRVALVNYAVSIACALSLTTGQQGTTYLEYADDSGFTTNVVTVNQFVNGNTGTLAIGLALTQTVTGMLSGVIPAGKYVRLRTQNNTGTPTFTFQGAQEVLV